MAGATSALASIAGAAASGPLGGIASIIDAAKGIIGEVVPDQNAKLAANTRLAELQIQLQQQQMTELTDQVKASAAANASDSVAHVRTLFCYAVTLLYLWNYAICRFAHQTPVDLPMSLNVIFATIMLGFVGVPAALDVVNKVLALPGESSINALGMKLGNKS